MCGRKVITSDADLLSKTFNVIVEPNVRELLRPSYNVSPGQLVPVITQEDPGILQLFYWGLTPSWSTKRMYLINARAEGKNNTENGAHYSGPMGISSMPSFRDPIKRSRCLIPVDGFYEGDEQLGLDRPYFCYMTSGHAFTLAGIYSYWRSPANGQTIATYAVITSYPNELTQAIGHHRCPVVIMPENHSLWMDPKASAQQISALLHPPPASEMNAYPVSTRVKSVKNNDPGLIQPTGPTIYR